MRQRMVKSEMNIKKACFVAVVVGHICFLSILAGPGDAPQILLTGTFHGNEVRAHSGDKWLALVPSGEGCALEETLIHIEYVRDELQDEDGEATGKMVSIHSDKKPLLLVRGVQGLTPGKVETAFPKTLNLEVNRMIPLKLSHGPIHELMVVCDETTPLTVDNFRGCPLILSNKYKSQVIGNFQVCFAPNSKPVIASDAGPSLIWAGDIDRDGALDLLLDLSNHYNISALTLFLSSGTQSDELVVKVAEFIIYGC
jgi:hypothetical protein